jgi:hypothetical protein
VGVSIERRASAADLGFDPPRLVRRGRSTDSARRNSPVASAIGDRIAGTVLGALHVDGAVRAHE